MRSPFILAMNLFAFIGHVILLTNTKSGVNYFATYPIAMPLYARTGLSITWINNNMAPHYRRAAALGCNQSMGNLAGVIAGQVYRKAPYTLGNAFSLGCVCVGSLATVAMALHLRHSNTVKAQILNAERKDTKKDRMGSNGLKFVNIL